MFDNCKILGEFDTIKGGLDDGCPNLIQSWVPMKYPCDLDPAKKHYGGVWCVSLAGGKRVELRPGDRVIVLRPKEG
jgi:hypothetical protein